MGSGILRVVIVVEISNSDLRMGNIFCCIPFVKKIAANDYFETFIYGQNAIHEVKLILYYVLMSPPNNFSFRNRVDCRLFEDLSANALNLLTLLMLELLKNHCACNTSMQLGYLF